jgi:hypothetical protein
LGTKPPAPELLRTIINNHRRREWRCVAGKLPRGGARRGESLEDEQHWRERLLWGGSKVSSTIWRSVFLEPCHKAGAAKREEMPVMKESLEVIRQGMKGVRRV